MKNDFDKGGCEARAPYALMVEGDIMEPEFQDGAVIIVDPALPHTHGAYVVADYEGETYFRLFELRESQQWLISTNEKHENILIEKTLEVRGVVTQQARNRKMGIKKARHYIKGYKNSETGPE